MASTVLPIINTECLLLEQLNLRTYELQEHQVEHLPPLETQLSNAVSFRNKLMVHYLALLSNKFTIIIYYYKYNDAKRKSHEQELITKKCIATHINYF